jgi:RimJ/RimL family protein N-acetyltransferase
MKVQIRPLQLADSDKSWQWRNNHQIWRFTGNRPNKLITAVIEREWLREALCRSDEVRFAICIGDGLEYVGNAQLTSITNDDAEYHIFIGEVTAYGKGIGSKTTELVLDYAKHILGLKSVYLNVNPANIQAIRIYEKCGFIFNNEINNQLIYRKIL